MEKVTLFLQSVVAGDPRSLFLVAAVYLFIVCGYSCIYQYRMKYWPGTRGQLKRAQITHFGSERRAKPDQQFIGDALYAYQVDGITYTGDKISPWVMVASHNVRFLLDRQLAKVSMGADGDITVYYNPRKPEKSVLIRP
ncbi:MAG: DUF3592 domain-containing protein [Gammaproteobacteria bacterium]|nr:DUF3592 domain-containing protein [Gammaproteobacteria bacterium]